MAPPWSHWVRDDVARRCARSARGSRASRIMRFLRVAAAATASPVPRCPSTARAMRIDIRAVPARRRRRFELTDPVVARRSREQLRKAPPARRFSTVLGPGSDGYHERPHPRRSRRAPRGHRMCQWNVLDPPVTAGADVPLPRPARRASGLTGEMKDGAKRNGAELRRRLRTALEDRFSSTRRTVAAQRHLRGLNGESPCRAPAPPRSRPS